MKSTPPPRATPADASLARTAVPAGYDRAASTMALQPLLQQLGVDLHQALAESGLPLGMFDHPDNLVPFRDGSRLLGLCADRSGCAHLGLLIGRHSPLESLGILADLAKAAPDVRSALYLLVRYLKLSDGCGLLALHESSRFAHFSYALYEPGVERAEVVYDLAMAWQWTILRALCGNRWLPHEVLLTRRRPADIRPYRSFLRAPLRFDCDESAVVFDKQWLDRPLHSADPRRLNALQAQARAIEAQSTGDLPARVRQVMRRQLYNGGSSMHQVAGELGMHRRTLDRHLKDQGLSFRALGDELRFEMARQLLSTTRMQVVEVAQSLHYANAGAFSTAFRRWSGSSPSQWRSTVSALETVSSDG